MKLIAAQGNPGLQYAMSRHNIGWMMLDKYLGERKLAEFQSKPKFLASVAEATFTSGKVLFVKPETFYNETGQALRKLSDFYKIDTKDILVIHDDLALEFGTIRTRVGGSDGGNNGIKSLNAHLGEGYARIRIGIDNDLRPNFIDSDFVLSRFSNDEMQQIDNQLVPACHQLIDSFLEGKLKHDSTKVV